MTTRILIGDVRAKLAELPDESVHCVVTSPPYFGLRDYGVAGQIGLEDTPAAFVAVMVDVFREVKRVLRNDGVCFINLGDSYCSSSAETPYKLREDCSLEDLENVALAVFGVRIDREETTRERSLPEVLPVGDQGRSICEGPSLEGAGIAQELSPTSNGRDGALSGAEQADETGRGECARREVRLLRREDDPIHDAGSHQRRRRSTSKEGRQVNDKDLPRGEARRISEGSISNPLLQLQLRNRIMGLMSSREFTTNEIPARLRSCFRPAGLKPKDLIGIPWRVAFALQDDGWYLRQDIIWSKPNPMPESVTDRCTKAHEYLFLLSKSARYHYDAAAIAEAVTESSIARLGQPTLDQQTGSDRVPGKTNGTMKAVGGTETRNRRSVWTVATQPFSEAHFATFPPALIEPCILAGCPKDCCAKCGAPVVRAIEKSYEPTTRTPAPNKGHLGNMGERAANMTRDGFIPNRSPVVKDLGWSPSCSCDAGTARGVCLDPFGGAGTTALVADRLGRDAVLIELNEQYAEMAKRRLETDAGMFGRVDLVRSAQKQSRTPAPLSVAPSPDDSAPLPLAAVGGASA